MSIHDMTHKAFIAEILSGGVSLHDIETRCKGDAHETDAVFASLIEAEVRLITPKDYVPLAAPTGRDDVMIEEHTQWNENPWYQDPNTGEWKRIINFPELARVEDAIIFVQSLMDAATEGTDNAKADAMPKVLQSPEADKYFQRAIESRLMSEDYKWLDGLQMLACFAEAMSRTLHLGKGERISWKPFETLFGIPYGKLRSNLNDIHKTGSTPKNERILDEIFAD